MNNNYIICLDNGHGINCPGKCSPDKKLKEFEYTREIVSMLEAKLKENGYKVFIVTPEQTDISLKTRCQRINKVCKENGNNAISISIHCNAAGADGNWHNASGWSVFVSKNSSQNSKELAKLLYDEATAMNLKGNRSVPVEHYWIQDLAMCRDTICPAVLTENLFQDNKEDVKFLLTEKGKQTIVDIHYNGIVKWIQNKSYSN